jgi:hypothetical protein
MPLEGKLAEIYVTLWNRDEDATPAIGARYSTHRGMPDEYRTSLGIFVRETREGNKHPGILVFRPERVPAESTEPDVATATLGELITLAHERGHATSYRAETYVEKSLAEERRAWEHARSMLEELGFAEWDAFNERQKLGLELAAEHGYSA